LRQCRRHDLRFHATFDRQRPGMRLAGVPRVDAELRYGADRGQRFAAKAQRANA
jgi:hypothetical protein